MDKYLQSVKKDFWARVFEAELEFILDELKGVRDILSVGCGPAVIEAGLAERGFNVTGLDISEVALGEAQKGIRTVVGSAESMDFADSSFDAVIYVVSLQFIEGYEKALSQTARVLRDDGRVLVLLLNPKSEFFKAKFANPDSYVRRIRHTEVDEIEKTIGKYFCVEQTKYFLGIRDGNIFRSRDPDAASLYVIRARRQRRNKGGLN